MDFWWVVLMVSGNGGRSARVEGNVKESSDFMVE